MTKTEIKKHINKSVYEFVTALGYQISDDNDGSYVTFSKTNFKSLLGGRCSGRYAFPNIPPDRTDGLR
jgi:hypothetical protein